MNKWNIFAPPCPKDKYEVIHWGYLPGASLPLAISALSQSQAQPLLLVNKDKLSAAQLYDDLKSFLTHRSDIEIIFFPDWETLPYDNFSPHEDLISERLKCFATLGQRRRVIIITAVTTLVQKLPPPTFIHNYTFILKCGMAIQVDALRHQLSQGGYISVSQVREHGEFAVRGGIVDIFPMGSREPFRLDLLGDELDTIRTFDPETQRSLVSLDEITLLPAHEFPLDEAGITLFRRQWRENFLGNPLLSPVYEAVSQGIAPAGIEYYFPLFFEQTGTLFDYLSPDAVLIQIGNVYEASEQYWQEIQMRYEQRNLGSHRPLLPPAHLFLAPNELAQLSKTLPRIQLDHFKEGIKKEIYFAVEPMPELLVDHKSTAPFQKLQQFIAEHPRVLLSTESTGRREAVRELLLSHQILPTLCESWQDFQEKNISLGLTISPLQEGIISGDPVFSIITENQLFPYHVPQKRRRKVSTIDAASLVRDLSELKMGDPVVHIEYGIGLYCGLTTLEVNRITNEFLVLQYADADKIYVPVTSLHLISRYSGSKSEGVVLHKLGNPKWAREKKQAKATIRDVAAELLAIQAQRAGRAGFSYAPPNTAYYDFVSEFPFEETPDQTRAIEQVIDDMVVPRSMDRLICGDVGFGKTEVAMRATMLALQSSKQVAILVPTTLLAEQHFINFRDRFVNTGARMEHLSRFRSTKESEAVLKDLVAGKVDCVIGTHKLLQRDIQFKNLGLVIIDEEHRFGVRQKEHLKALRAEVDVLALTATPIPRTLNMSLAGLRDISIIATPPLKRLSVKTFVLERNAPIMQEAISREIMRGGQVFFLHNKVETIRHIADEIIQLVPQARVEVAHGQMPERQLEKVMTDFYHQRFNVLVCTTIIENGIDIPSANTIIIDRADNFGLSQLHQLRGRVGRSHHQAYAYLMTPHPKNMTKDAEKRLEAIHTLGELGVGFNLAMQDLEIRGAGELLGEEQSGNIDAIGYSLYMEYLNNAVEALKQGKTLNLDQVGQTEQCECNLQIPAFIPHEYIHDVNVRLILYQRISTAKNMKALDDLQVEMIDRFGLLPSQVKYLIQLTTLKLQAVNLGIKRLEANSQGGKIEFQENPKVNIEQVMKLLRLKPAAYKMASSAILRFIKPNDSAEMRLKIVEEVLQELVNDLKK